MTRSKLSALLMAAVLCLFGASLALATDGIGDTLWSFPAPGQWPSGLAWDGSHLWLSDNESDSFYRLTTEGVVEAAFPLFDSFPSPAGMTFIGDKLWMVDENTSTLYQVDPATGAALKSFGLPDTNEDASSWGLAWDGNHLWHSEYAHGNIYELDTTDGSVILQFASPDPWIMGIEYDGQYLWGVSTQTNQAYVMSLPSGTVVHAYSWQVPYSLGMTLANGYMWCVSMKPPMGTGRVYGVDIGQDGLAEGPRVGPPRRLAGAAPNPFRTRTSISAGPGSPAIVGARVFDVQGRFVRNLSAERGAVTWDGADRAGRRSAPGTYVVCVRLADGSTEQRPVRLNR